MIRKFSFLLVVVAILIAVVPAFAQEFQIPEIEEGKTNVAVVLIGPIKSPGLFEDVATRETGRRPDPEDHQPEDRVSQGVSVVEVRDRFLPHP